MLRRDFLQAEISKLAQALAKIMGVKEAGQKQEADGLIRQNLIQGFDFNFDESLLLDKEQFKELLLAKNYPSQKLDLLSQFLYEKVSPFQTNLQTVIVLNQLLTIYELLEQEYHTQSLENLNRKQAIIQFLNHNEQYG